MKTEQKILNMMELLQKLADSNLVRVTGSFADGSQVESSDIDFFVKPDHPDYKILGHKRNIEKVKDILDEFEISVNSSMVGYWYSHRSNNPNLERDIEFSDLFRPRKNRIKKISIMGIDFKTF